MNHLPAPAVSRELSYSEIVTGDTGMYSYTHPTRVKVFDPEAVHTGMILHTCMHERNTYSYLPN